MPWSSDSEIDSQRSRDIRHQNERALGGPGNINQQAINEAIAAGIHLSSPDNPNAYNDQIAARGGNGSFGNGAFNGQVSSDVAPTPAPASQRPVATQPPNGSVIIKPTGNRKGPAGPAGVDPGAEDYLDMIMDASFGPRARPNHAPADAGMLTKQAPVPRDRPSWMTNEDEGNRALDAAEAQGHTLEQIAGGVAGAAAAYAAYRVLQGSRNAPSTNIPIDGQTNTGTNVQLGPRPSRPGNGSTDILKRNGLTQGVPSNNTDIDAQFYEIFGLPMPNHATGVRQPDQSVEPRLLPPTTEGGATRQGYVPARPATTDNTQPREQMKQLGDMDSPRFRDQMIPGSAAETAKRIVDQMEMYGETDPTAFGITPDNRPAVWREIMRMIN